MPGGRWRWNAVVAMIALCGDLVSSLITHSDEPAKCRNQARADRLGHQALDDASEVLLGFACLGMR